MIAQILSRKNDVNGNPHRLVCIYGKEGEIKEVYHYQTSWESSMKECHPGMIWIQSISLTPSEFNAIKKNNDCKRGKF